MIVEGERVASFVADRTGTEFQPPFTTLGFEKDGEVVAGFIFTSWTGPDVTLTMAVAGRLPRAFLRRVADYVWGELGCLRASVETEQEHVANLALRMGGKVEGVKRNFYGPGRDAVCFGILKEEWFMR